MIDLTMLIENTNNVVSSPSSSSKSSSILSSSSQSSPSTYLCLDISKQKRVLVSQWAMYVDSDSDLNTSQELTHQQSQSHSHQQIQSQFPNESPKMSPRRSSLPTSILGMTLAKQHSSDEYLNLMFRQWSRAKMECSFRQYHLTHICKDKNFNTDRTVNLARRYGTAVCFNIMNNLMHNYAYGICANTSESPHHTHLVSPQRSRLTMMLKKIVSQRRFRHTQGLPNTLPLCEEEDSTSSSSSSRSGSSCRRSSNLGQVGRDLGMPFTYPLACAIAYAIQGQSEEVDEILQSLNSFWKSYAAKLSRQGKEKAYIRDAYRYGIGWCGWFLYIAYYRMAAYMDVLPIKARVDDEDKERVLDAIGYVGLQLMHVGFAETEPEADVEDSEDSLFNSCRSLEQLVEKVDSILNEEVESLLEVSLLNNPSFFATIKSMKEGGRTVAHSCIF